MCNNLSLNIREALKKLKGISQVPCFVLMSLLPLIFGTNHICGRLHQLLKNSMSTFYSFTITSLACHHNHKVQFSSPPTPPHRCQNGAICIHVSLSCVYFISFSILEVASIHKSLQLRFITILNDSIMFLNN